MFAVKSGLKICTNTVGNINSDATEIDISFNFINTNARSQIKPPLDFSLRAVSAFEFDRLNYGDENILSVSVNFHGFPFINLNDFARTVDHKGDALGIIAFLHIVGFGNRAIDIC